MLCFVKWSDKSTRTVVDLQGHTNRKCVQRQPETLPLFDKRMLCTAI